MKPSSPWVTLILGLAAFLGLFLGFSFAVLSEYFDHGLRDKEDVRDSLGVPLLATVPRVKSWQLGTAQPASG